jgi:proteasome lid subunit RPN8/RPN11
MEQAHVDALVAQALAELPNECCGMLAGTIESSATGTPVARVAAVFPLVNKTASPIEYDAEPTSLIRAVQAARHRDLEIVAIYHSHPTSPPVPSKKDMARSYWEGVVYLILSLAGPKPVLRGWWLNADSYREADWEVAAES